MVEYPTASSVLLPVVSTRWPSRFDSPIRMMPRTRACTFSAASPVSAELRLERAATRSAIGSVAVVHADAARRRRRRRTAECVGRPPRRHRDAVHVRRRRWRRPRCAAQTAESMPPESPRIDRAEPVLRARSRASPSTSAFQTLLESSGSSATSRGSGGLRVADRRAPAASSVDPLRRARRATASVAAARGRRRPRSRCSRNCGARARIVAGRVDHDAVAVEDQVVLPADDVDVGDDRVVLGRRRVTSGRRTSSLSALARARR